MSLCYENPSWLRSRWVFVTKIPVGSEVAEPLLQRSQLSQKSLGLCYYNPCWLRIRLAVVTTIAIGSEVAGPLLQRWQIAGNTSGVVDMCTQRNCKNCFQPSLEASHLQERLRVFKNQFRLFETRARITRLKYHYFILEIFSSFSNTFFFLLPGLDVLLLHPGVEVQTISGRMSYALRPVLAGWNIRNGSRSYYSFGYWMTGLRTIVLDSSWQDFVLFLWIVDDRTSYNPLDIGWQDLQCNN